MKCPICEIEMRITDRDGVEIDYCPQCRGVWLDRGELEKIVARFESQAAPPYSQDNRKDHHDHDRKKEYYDHEKDRHEKKEYYEQEKDHHEKKEYYEQEKDRKYRDNGKSDTREQDSYRHDERGGRKREGFFSNLLDMLGGD